MKRLVAASVLGLALLLPASLQAQQGAGAAQLKPPSPRPLSPAVFWRSEDGPSTPNGVDSFCGVSRTLPNISDDDAW